MMDQVGSATCPSSGTHGGDSTMFNDIHLPIPSYLTAEKLKGERNLFFVPLNSILTKLS